MSPVRYVFIGVATFDTIASVERFPSADERVVAEEITRAGGGPAATAAVAAARLGVPVGFVGSVGDDDDADTIIAELTAEGVDTSGVTRVPDAPSATSLVVVDSSEGTRAIINRPPPPIHLSDTAIELIGQADWVHVDQAGWVAFCDRWTAAGRQPQLSIDAGNPVEGFSPAGVQLYVPTIRALRDRYGDLTRHELLRAALDEGAHTVVATDGGAGSFALADRDGSMVHAPPIAGSVASTLGAGDVFHGALLAAIHHGDDLAGQLHYANHVAFASCQGLDGRSAIPTHEQVVATMATCSCSTTPRTPTDRKLVVR